MITIHEKKTYAAVFEHGGGEGRIAFTLSRWNLLRLSLNCLLAFLRGEDGIAIASDSLTILERVSDEEGMLPMIAEDSRVAGGLPRSAEG